MKIFAAVILSLTSLSAHAHWETDENFIGQHCVLATAKGPLKDFTIFYRLKHNVLLNVDRVDVQWDLSLAAYTENDTFRRIDLDAENGSEDLGIIRKVKHSASNCETTILIAATKFDLTIDVASDHKGGSAIVSFVSKGPKSKAHYRCTGVKFR